MTSLSNAFALYNRLEQHLKRATNERPLTVNTAYHLGDINDLAGAPHNVATAFESLTRKGLVTKIRMEGREREGNDKNAQVAYFWTPEKIEEHIPPLPPHTGNRQPARKKPINSNTGRGIPFAKAEDRPMEKVDTIVNVTPLPEYKGIRLDFGGKVFTAPEGCKVDVHTAADGLSVTFVLPPSGN